MEINRDVGKVEGERGREKEILKERGRGRKG